MHQATTSKAHPQGSQQNPRLALQARGAAAAAAQYGQELGHELHLVVVRAPTLYVQHRTQAAPAADTTAHPREARSAKQAERPYGLLAAAVAASMALVIGAWT